MAKTNKKLSVKKETLRTLDSLTSEQLGRVAGGTNIAYSVIVPPSKGPVSGGCTEDFIALKDYNVVKGYP